MIVMVNNEVRRSTVLTARIVKNSSSRKILALLTKDSAADQRPFDPELVTRLER